MRTTLLLLLATSLCCGLFCGCGKESAPATPQTFVAKGVVKELDPDGKTVVISHEAISNYMPAMTMPFEARDTNELRGLTAGDSITFHLVVTPTHGWIEGITKLNIPPVNPAPSPASHLSFSPAVAELDEGDSLPDYHFTNELGAAMSLSQFHGEVLAFTFFFTSCPFPDFCPRMTSNFAETAKRLAAMTNAPAKWQMLSISFDPTNDTPFRLLKYAEAAHYDPSHWSFLTGDEKQISGLAEQFGENFWREGATVGHNLRTVVVGPNGKILKILNGNKWTVDELVDDMVKAAE